MSILKLLGLQKVESQKTAEISKETETVKKIEQTLEGMDPRQAKFHALFAGILSRVAHADLHISEDEVKAMEEVLVKLGHLTEEMAALVVEIAKSHTELFGGVESYLITRNFNEIATQDDKYHLLECLFAVAAADQNISEAENKEIEKIARELQITHSDLLGVRHAFREHMAVLKDLPS